MYDFFRLFQVTFWTMDVIWLALVVIVIAHSATTCPPQCECDRQTRSASCRHKAFTAVPEGLPTDIVSLNLDGNHISALYIHSFDRFVYLRSLDLRDNKIAFIENGTFAPTAALQRLNLAGNQLTSFDVPLPVTLSELDVSFNRLSRIEPPPTIGKLNISGNAVSNISNICFRPGSRLEQLDLSRNNFTIISSFAFKNVSSLQVLRMNDEPHLFHINKTAFSGLSSLHTLEIRNNPRFPFIHKDLFRALTHLRTLDLSKNNLTSLYAEAFSSLPRLESLDVHDNPLLCNCALKWLQSTKVRIEFANETLCFEPPLLRSAPLLELSPENLTCIAPKIVNYTHNAFFKLGTQAVLKCLVEGEPQPLVVWTTPSGRVFRHNDYLQDQWNRNPSKEDVLNDLYHSNGQWQAVSHEYHIDFRPNRIQLLSNGDLFISYVQRNDAGDYRCTAVSPGGNDTLTLNFMLNYIIIKDITVASMIVGFSSAGIFFGFGLLVALVRYVSQKCAERQRKKSRSIRKIIGHLDSYRSQQMEKLRDSYGGHVFKMKEHAFGQMDKMRENYFSQIARIQEKCALQMDRLRENYNAQMGKIKGYSSLQVEKVRDNYNNQMIKIRDYGSTQLEKLRETYKLQHQHMMKILEAMNIDNCRGMVDSECIRANSMLFETRFTLDNIDINLANMNIDMDNIHLDNVNLSKESSHNSIYICDDFLTANSDCEGLSLNNVDADIDTTASVHGHEMNKSESPARVHGAVAPTTTDDQPDTGTVDDVMFVIDVDDDSDVGVDLAEGVAALPSSSMV